MASTKYTYSISADTLNAKYGPKLPAEIQASSIVTALDHIDSAGDVLDIWMAAALSGGDETTLDGVVGSHDGTSEVLTTPVQLVKADGTDVPATSDGKPIFNPNIFPGVVQLSYPGQADDVSSGLRFGGLDFCLGFESGDAFGVGNEKTAVFQFGEEVYIAGGAAHYVGAVLGDWLEYELNAPATPATENTGSGAYGKISVGGGISVFVNPAAPGADGANWDINLTELRYGSCATITKACPVPVTDQDNPNGFFDYSSDTYALTYNAAGTGLWNLFDTEINLSVWASKLKILGSGSESLETANIKTKKLLPHWEHKVTLFNSTAKDLALVWRLLLGRKRVNRGVLAVG